jgi:uncharacterized protein (TIGR02099 family)
VSPDSSAPESPIERLHRLEHAVEETVEHAVSATERSLARRFGAGCVRTLRWTLKAVGLVLLIGYFVSGLSLLAARYWLLPRIDEARPWIEQRASRALGTAVTIGAIDAGWRGFNPVLNLNAVRLTAPNGGTALELPRVEATLAWATAPLLWIRFESLTFVAPEVEVRRLADGRFQVAGFTLDPDRGGDGGALDWLLTQRELRIRDGRLRYVDEARPANDREVLFDDLDFQLRNGVTSHRFALRGRPPAHWSAPLDVRGNFDQPLFAPPSKIALWQGQMYLQSDFIDLARVAAFLRLRAGGERLASAQGALRLWASIDDARLLRLTADLALADVAAQLGADVEPLRVRRLQGRLTQRVWGDAQDGGQEIELGQISFGSTPGSVAPIGQLRLRTTRANPAHGARGELTVSALELGPVTALAPALPLPADWRAALARWQFGGRLPQLAASWEEGAQGLARYALQARFEQLHLAAQPAADNTPGVPGFAGLAGSIDFTEAGGSLRLAAAQATLDFPGVFEQPRLALERLDAVAHWTAAPRFELRLESLGARNAEFDLSAQGVYRRPPPGARGPGEIDAKGTVHRLAANAAWRYTPVAASANVRAWLRDALVAGEARDAHFSLRGDLDRFPWPAGGSGEFRAAGRIEGGVIDYVAGEQRDATGRALPGQVWPLLQGLQGQFVFAGNSVEVRATQARSYGLRVTQAVARIPDMAHEARLSIRGNGSGPLADLLRLVNGSPITRWIHGATEQATAHGNARFDLQLDIPLTHAADTRAAGAVLFAGNDLTLNAAVPPLTGIDGKLEFSERGISIKGLSAGFLGGRLTAEAGMQADGAVLIEGRGEATVAALGTSFDEPVLRLLARHSSGSLPYRGRLVLGGAAPLLDVASDLVGVSLNLPPPFAKTAAAPLPLRVQRRSTAAVPDEWQVTAGSLLDLRLLRMRNVRGAMQLARGAIGINAAVPLPAQGLQVGINLGELDATAWIDLLDALLPDAPLPAAPGRSALGVPITATLRADTLRGADVSLSDVSLAATRAPDGLWSGSLKSAQASGTLSWRPAQGATQALLTARLTQLKLPKSGDGDPAAATAVRAPRELPALDVVVEDFQLGQTRYGRLELEAVNTGSGAAAAWQLRKLKLDNPDALLSATGAWTPLAGGGGAGRISLKFALDIRDGGALLDRLGSPGLLRHAAGGISGELSWRGVPTRLDYPSLYGALNLDLKQGQFLKADPGAARLLSIISLQGLARRATLDFSSFESGFAFSSIVAQARLSAGVLSTSDFKMFGPQAAVLIEGSTDLAHETQKLRVVVLPDVNLDSASLLYAALINPAIGLGTFVAQWLLRDPLSKMFSLEYSVTGTWDDPVVQRLDRGTAPPAPAGTP